MRFREHIGGVVRQRSTYFCASHLGRAVVQGFLDAIKELFMIQHLLVGREGGANAILPGISRGSEMAINRHHAHRGHIDEGTTLTKTYVYLAAGDVWWFTLYHRFPVLSMSVNHWIKRMTIGISLTPGTILLLFLLKFTNNYVLPEECSKGNR